MPTRPSASGARTYLPSISSRPSKELSIVDIDDGSRALVQAEMDMLCRRNEGDSTGKRKLTLPSGHGTDQLMGLALSGGGIRSATFALGVLQVLAKSKTRDGKSILEKMDYLSTVSGGGYIGSSLTWYLSRGVGGIGPDGNGFPYGEPDSEVKAELSPPSRRLRYLRQHGNYLTPGEGIDLRSGIAMVLRAILLNLLVWLPTITLIMLVLVWFSAVLARNPCLVCGNFLAAWIPGFPSEPAPQAFLFLLLLALAGALFAVFIVACVYYSLQTARQRSNESTRRYGQRRFFEIWAGRLLTVIAVLIVVGSIPIAEEYLGRIGGGSGGANSGMLKETTGPVAVLLGMASALWSFFKTARSVEGWVPNRVVAPVGAGLLIYGLLLSAYSAAVQFGMEVSVTNTAIAIVLALLAGVTGLCVNVNYISLHRYYRDRLMEAFLPDPQSAVDNVTGPARLADPFRLAEAFDTANPRPLYHIINTNIVLADSPNRRRRIRGGDSFILSPLYCGSNATGWRLTEHFVSNSMTLATAMAISGAAANPNAGVGGVGLTRNRAISLLMALLNLRLGYWATNPLVHETKRSRPNHFWPGLYEVLGLVGWGGFREEAHFIELSDGGHFENLGCYELIRRKLRLIIVCDAGADPEFSFGDLQTMLHRVKEDFGATITFDGNDRLELLVPSKSDGFPKDSDGAKQSYVVGDIVYADETAGKLVLIKTTIVPRLSVEIKGYKGAHSDFPDETTADQFFDEDQFESYRQLGVSLAQTLIEDETLFNEIARIESGAAKPKMTPAGGET